MKVVAVLLACFVAAIYAQDREQLREFIRKLPYDECKQLFNMVIEENGGKLPDDLVGIVCQPQSPVQSWQPQQPSRPQQSYCNPTDVIIDEILKLQPMECMEAVRMVQSRSCGKLPSRLSGNVCGATAFVSKPHMPDLAAIGEDNVNAILQVIGELPTSQCGLFVNKVIQQYGIRSEGFRDNICCAKSEFYDFTESLVDAVLKATQCNSVINKIRTRCSNTPYRLQASGCSPVYPARATFQEVKPRPNLPYVPPQGNAQIANIPELTEADMADIARNIEEYNFEIDHYKAPALMYGGQRCRGQWDCPTNYICANIEGAWQDILTEYNDMHHFPIVKDAMSINGKECVYDSKVFFERDASRLMPSLYHSFSKLQALLNATGKDGQFDKYISKIQFVFDTDFDTLVTEPVTRQGFLSGGSSQSGIDQLLPIVILQSITGSGSTTLDPLMLLALTGATGGGGGVGDIFSNPLMLILFTNPTLLSGLTGTGSNSLITTLLLTQALGSGSAFGGSGPTEGLTLPLLLALTGSLGTGSTGSNDILTKLAPLLALGGTSGTGGIGGLMPLLLVTGLLNLTGSGGSSINQIIPLLFLSGGNQEMDPMLLLLLSGGFGSTGTGLTNLMSNPLLFFMLFQGMGSGSGDSIDSNLLLLLFASNMTGGNDLFKLLFLTDPKYANDPLTIFFLLGNTTGGSLSPLLLYMLFLGGGSGSSQTTSSSTFYTDPIGLGSIDNSIPPPGGAIIPPSTFGGTSSFTPQTGFGDGLLPILLIMMTQGGSTLDPTMLFLLFFLMNPNQGGGGLLGGSTGVQQPGQPGPQPGSVFVPGGGAGAPFDPFQGAGAPFDPFQGAGAPIQVAAPAGYDPLQPGVPFVPFAP